MLKKFIKSVRYMCSDEEGNFQATELIAGISFAAFIPALWLFLYALGAR